MLTSAERIDPRSPVDMRLWAAMLQVSHYELREAIGRVGNLRAAVERELDWNRTPRAR